MQHFSKDDGMNMFRLPVGWQYLVNGKLGGTLDLGNLAKYNDLVNACLDAGAYCIIDVSCPFALSLTSSCLGPALTVGVATDPQLYV